MIDGQVMRTAQGGLIDRTKTLQFQFDGRLFTGFKGDTLASALLANGVRAFGRSFKYHRLRGVWGSAEDEPNALVEVGIGAKKEPNTRATSLELFDGLQALSQNRWPSLRWDVMAINNLLSPLLTAGFYYKTFMWPAAFWEKVYEPLIRRSAGLGRAAEYADPDLYEKRNIFCDVLIIGAGPAGLSAALTAARAGLRVILTEQDFEMGGRLLAERFELNNAPALHWYTNLIKELESFDQVMMLKRTTVFGMFDHGTFGAIEQLTYPSSYAPEPAVRSRYLKIMAKRTILAAGALERPIAFGGNDRPGVMSAAATRAYLNRWAVKVGGKAAVFTSCDNGWQTAFDMHDAGVAIQAVIDVRKTVDKRLLEEAQRRDLSLLMDSAVCGTAGDSVLRSITVRDAQGRHHKMDCETLSVSGGWNPTLHLSCHLGAKPKWNESIACFVPDALSKTLLVVGSAAGHFGLKQCIEDGSEAALKVAGALNRKAYALEPVETQPEPSSVAVYFYVKQSNGKAFVDFQHDVTVADIYQAANEGYDQIEHTKRFTTMGMATDQGKTASVVGIGVLAEATHRSIAQTGTTVFRPPYTPVTIGALAGKHIREGFRPRRLTPLHQWAERHGASFVEVGLWFRAQWYAQPGECGWRDSVDREVSTVRSAVGFCDVSTLGKIEVLGPDAGRFLDSIYANNISNLAVGKVRYGLMLREDGFVMDDGTCARLESQRFFITTTTANAGRVLQLMELHHQLWMPEASLAMISTTDCWAQVSVAGPKSREVLQALVGSSVDLSNQVFDHMSCAYVTVLNDVPARLFRLSFSGELAYEIAVPSEKGPQLADALMEAGEPFGIAPYGTEALGVLRIEKGHPAGGELNGHTTAKDLGMEKLLSKKKNYIGQVLSQRPALCDPQRPSLVGIRPIDPAREIKAGAHFIGLGAKLNIENDEGYVTSAAYSPSLGSYIGLGLLKGGLSRLGERIRSVDLVRQLDVEVEICHPVFVDPEGARCRA